MIFLSKIILTVMICLPKTIPNALMSLTERFNCNALSS
jgi:hypothetical protein